jgi:hypothetical protein
MLLTDRLRTVPLHVTIAKSKSDKMSKPLAADTFVADVVLGPGEASSTGNVTGGRKLARYDFGRVRPDAIPHALLLAAVRFGTYAGANKRGLFQQLEA